MNLARYVIFRTGFGMNASKVLHVSSDGDGEDDDDDDALVSSNNNNSAYSVD
jgi:hypothetical protein